MAPICGIDAETLRTVARTFATAQRAIVFWGMGISQHVHGTDNARCLISLVMMCGHVGRPGTGLHPLRGQNNVQGASDAGLIPMMFPDYGRVGKDAVRERFEELWGTKLDPEPGLTVVEIVDAIHAGKIKGMYIMGENPAMSDPDAHHAREALAKLEHLVVQDLFLTETAMYADVVLPASAWPEKDGTVTNTNRQVQMGRAALPLPGEARQDWWIIQELARRIGLDWRYEHPREVFAEMERAMPSLDNITWERLEREARSPIPATRPDQPGHDIVFGDRFPTGDGRGRFTPADDPPAGRAAGRRVPDGADHRPPARALAHRRDDPARDLSRRARARGGGEPASQDLRRLGVAPGEPIRVATRRGAIELMARADRAVPEGMVFIPFCFAEAAANLLTNPQLDPYRQDPRVQVLRRAGGEGGASCGGIGTGTEANDLR